MITMFAVLADPVRRRLVELLAEGDQTAGDLTTVIQREFGINQPAVSNHLRSLRDAGVVANERDGRLRRYHLQWQRLEEIDEWLQARRSFFDSALDALETEVARGKHGRRRGSDHRTGGSTARGRRRTA